MAKSQNRTPWSLNEIAAIKDLRAANVGWDRIPEAMVKRGFSARANGTYYTKLNPKAAKPKNGKKKTAAKAPAPVTSLEVLLKLSTQILSLPIAQRRIVKRYVDLSLERQP